MTEKTQIQQRKHMTRKLFERWQEGSLSDQEEADFLEHTGSCTYCAERFADWMEEGLLEEPPAYLKEEIADRIRQADIRIAVKVKYTSKQMQLMMYSLKVGLAVAASIFLLILTTDVQRMGMELPEDQKNEAVQDTEAVQKDEAEKKEESLTYKLNQGSSRLVEYLNQLTDTLFHTEQDGSVEERNRR